MSSRFGSVTGRWAVFREEQWRVLFQSFDLALSLKAPKRARRILEVAEPQPPGTVDRGCTVRTLCGACRGRRLFGPSPKRHARY